MKSAKRKGVSQRIYTGKMQNCGSFSVLLFLIMALFLTFPNIFFTFGKKNIINYGYPMMKGWRIIMLKGDRV